MPTKISFHRRYSIHREVYILIIRIYCSLDKVKNIFDSLILPHSLTLIYTRARHSSKITNSPEQRQHGAESTQDEKKGYRKLELILGSTFQYLINHFSISSSRACASRALDFSFSSSSRRPDGLVFYFAIFPSMTEYVRALSCVCIKEKILSSVKLDSFRRRLGYS